VGHSGVEVGRKKLEGEGRKMGDTGEDLLQGGRAAVDSGGTLDQGGG
jgi:hypothetical protein